MRSTEINRHLCSSSNKSAKLQMHCINFVWEAYTFSEKILYFIRKHQCCLEELLFSLYTTKSRILKSNIFPGYHSTSLRHGPFDILGGAWDLCLGRKIFFGQYRSKVIFFAGPSGRIIFFMTKSYKYKDFRNNFMLKSGFRKNYMLNSGFHNKFRLNSCFCHQFKSNLGFRDNCMLQEEQPDSFIVNRTLFLGSLANFTLGLI